MHGRTSSRKGTSPKGNCSKCTYDNGLTISDNFQHLFESRDDDWQTKGYQGFFCIEQATEKAGSPYSRSHCGHLHHSSLCVSKYVTVEYWGHFCIDLCWYRQQ